MELLRSLSSIKVLSGPLHSSGVWGDQTCQLSLSYFKMKEQQQFGTCALGRGTQLSPIRPQHPPPARNEMLVLSHTKDRVAPAGTKQESRAKPRKK